MEAGRESRVRGEVAACSRLLCRIDLGGGGLQPTTGRTNRLPTVWDGAPDQGSEDLAAERACNEAHGNPKSLSGGRARLNRRDPSDTGNGENPIKNTEKSKYGCLKWCLETHKALINQGFM
jgi:hypothetical protein